MSIAFSNVHSVERHWEVLRCGRFQMRCFNADFCVIILFRMRLPDSEFRLEFPPPVFMPWARNLAEQHRMDMGLSAHIFVLKSAPGFVAA